MREEVRPQKGIAAHRRERRASSSRARCLAASGAVLMTLAVAACGDDDKTQFSEQALEFTEQPSENFGFSDNPPRTRVGEEGPEKLSNGDAITFTSALLDRSRKQVGDLDVACTVTRAGGFDASRQQCVGTATVPGGVLTLARGGRVFAGESTRGAVVGGSGRYAGATGHFTEAEQRGDRTRYSFRIVVPER